MIKTIIIKDLFRRFDYSIDTMSDGITIITGPNGFGKSTILRIINALSCSDLLYFLQLEFKQINVVFDSGLTTTIEKTTKGIKIDDSVFEITQNLATSLQRIKRRPWIIQTSDGYIDRRTEERITEEELLTRYLLQAI